MKHTLTLDYSLSPGWLQPFTAGVRSGKAIARRCENCGRVSFPPLRVCDCGSDRGSWIELSGKAGVLTRTTGSDGDFALALFEGADTQTVVRLADFGADDRQGAIEASEGAMPAIVLRATPAGRVS